MGIFSSKKSLKTTSVAEAKVSAKQQKPNVNLTVGNHVANRWPTVVFIFGGPGTQKGKYIDSLVDQYGLRRVTISEVLERELDEVHVYETRSAEMVNVGIGTVMQWFVKRMRTDANAPGFLIDIVPNIKHHLRSRFATESCQQALTDFENTYPVSFVLELEQLYDEKPWLPGQPQAASTARAMPNAGARRSGSQNAIPQPPIAVRLGMRPSSTSSGGTGRRTPPGSVSRGGGSGRRSSSKAESEKPETSISDEADSHKKMRRATLYRECSRQFIRYFTDAGKTIRIVSPAAVDFRHSWNRLSQVLLSLGLKQVRPSPLCVVFEFDQRDALVSYDKYNVKILELSQIVVNPGDHPQRLLGALRNYIREQGLSTQAVVVRLQGTSVSRFVDAALDDVSPFTKWIRFADVGAGEGTLDQYLLGRYSAPAAPGGSRAGKFRPIGTCDDEVCLFPVSAAPRLCAVVASLFSKSLTTYAVDATPLLRSHLLNRNDDRDDEPQVVHDTSSASIMRHGRSEPPLQRTQRPPGHRRDGPPPPASNESPASAANQSDTTRPSPYPNSAETTRPSPHPQHRPSVKHGQRER